MCVCVKEVGLELLFSSLVEFMMKSCLSEKEKKREEVKWKGKKKGNRRKGQHKKGKKRKRREGKKERERKEREGNREDRKEAKKRMEGK